MESETDSQTSTLTIFNHRRRTRQHHTASEHHVGCGMTHSVHATCTYSTRLALFIHRIMSTKRMYEVRPAILVRESSTQLIMYLLDTCIRYSAYIPIFKSQKGSTEALNFWKLPHRLRHHFLITAENKLLLGM